MGGPSWWETNQAKCISCGWKERTKQSHRPPMSKSRSYFGSGNPPINPRRAVAGDFGKGPGAGAGNRRSQSLWFLADVFGLFSNNVYVRDLARYYRRSPELISYEEVTDWVYHLITERLLSASSVNIAVSAVRFLYGVTLGRETLDLMASVPHMKRATPRAEVYARSEVEAILTAPRQPRDRVLLMTVYGCGLRISEATQLKISDIDRARMQLRVRDGKGAKGRVLPLSERLLTELVSATSG